MAVDEQEVSSNHGVQGLLLSDTGCINYRVAGVDPELSMGGVIYMAASDTHF